MTERQKAAAITKAARLQKALNTAEGKAANAALDRDRAVYAAQKAGATYVEVRQATGLSITRITQILRRCRAADA